MMKFSREVAGPPSYHTDPNQSGVIIDCGKHLRVRWMHWMTLLCLSLYQRKCKFRIEGEEEEEESAIKMC